MKTASIDNISSSESAKPRDRMMPQGRGRAKRVLVAGGAGFLGSHLCEKLIEGGDTVLCIDNFSTRALAEMSSISCRATVSRSFAMT